MLKISLSKVFSNSWYIILSLPSKKTPKSNTKTSGLLIKWKWKNETDEFQLIKVLIFNFAPISKGSSSDLINFTFDRFSSKIDEYRSVGCGLT